MTSKQMLERITPKEEPQPPTGLDWTPAERTTPIIVGNVNIKALVYQAQSDALRQGKCPICHSQVAHEVKKDQMVYFQCVKQPVWHEWRRPMSFLTND